MIVTIGVKNLFNLVKSQLKNNFSCDDEELLTLEKYLQTALAQTFNCFQNIANKYYRNADKEVIFNPFHSDQNAIFLYFLSKTISKSGHAVLADKVYYLNKMLNACDLFHEIQLPEIFCLGHPIGSIIGRASFGNFLVVQQSCTIGSNYDSNNLPIFPSFGEYVWMFANAMVIGDCRIGNNVFISANCYIKDEDIPDNTIVFGQSPNLVLKQRPAAYFYGLSPFTIHHT